MKKLALLGLSLLVTACGPSEQDINNTVIITCNIMGESPRIDSAFRIKEINAAREKIGARPYLGDDAQIRDSFELGLCEELVRGDGSYEIALLKIQRKKEVEREAQKREEARQAVLEAENEAREAQKRAELVATLGESGAAGYEIYERYACEACHGPLGGGGIGPKLLGRDASYISKRLTAYKNYETVGPQSALKWNSTQSLSDQAILDVSAFVSNFK